MILPGRTDIISAAGAFVIGLLGNAYSRVVGGTAFTSMVTGVLFLVPVSTSQSSDYHIRTTFLPSLALRKVAAWRRATTLQLNSIQQDFHWPFV